MSSSGLDPVELNRIAERFDTNGGQIDEQLRIIQRWVEQTRPAWSGQAGMGFQSVSEMWGAQQARIIRLLHEAADSVREYSKVSITATDEANQAVRVTLPLDNRVAS